LDEGKEVGCCLLKGLRVGRLIEWLVEVARSGGFVVYWVLVDYDEIRGFWKC
jgi:hypothetical protein